MMNAAKPTTDASWYFAKDPEADRYYDIFFMMCRKYQVNWASAGMKERAFIEEVTRVTYERDRASRTGQDPSEIRPAFAS